MIDDAMREVEGTATAGESDCASARAEDARTIDGLMAAMYEAISGPAGAPSGWGTSGAANRSSGTSTMPRVPMSTNTFPPGTMHRALVRETD